VTITVAATRQRVLDLELRMPFHFGETTIRDLPHLFVSVELGGEFDGATGVASENLSPTWFLSNVSFEDGINDTYEVVEAALDHAREVEADTVFEFWHRVYERQRDWAADTDHPPLLWAFGVTFVERAVIDAFCRARDVAFGRAIRDGSLGIDLGAIHPELADETPADLLPSTPRRETTLRHTVGATDPLTADDVDPEERLDDGLPRTLAEYLRAQDLSHFKIKLTGDIATDAERLADVEQVLGDREYTVTLDANERYGDAVSLKRDWEALTDDTAAERLLDRVMYVEQPLARGHALSDDARETFTAWDDRPPVIIDESDAELDSLRRALDCGYAGTSHKNCKGVFKGVVNACLLEHRRRENGGEYVLSGEDLSTVGPLSLQQDLAVMATLGVDHLERNGHHYFRGMSMLPPAVQTALLSAHDDLYRRHEEGFPTVDGRGGRLSLASSVDAPFGRALTLDLAEVGRDPN